MVVTLGYWDIRGLAHAIRLLLEYTGTPYQEKRYVFGPAPDYDRSDWTKEKEKLGLDFPNLPYLIDGTVKLTQSNAILRYIARRHNMCGETEQERMDVDMLENHLMDFQRNIGDLCYSPDFEKLKPEYLEQLPGKLRELSRFLGSRQWFVGDKLTYVDFLAYDVLDQHRVLAPDCPELQGNLSQFLQRFEVRGLGGAHPAVTCAAPGTIPSTPVSLSPPLTRGCPNCIPFPDTPSAPRLTVVSSSPSAPLTHGPGCIPSTPLSPAPHCPHPVPDIPMSVTPLSLSPIPSAVLSSSPSLTLWQPPLHPHPQGSSWVLLSPSPGVPPLHHQP
ncbi:glutathione S-transferase 2-like [Melanerpes formicivorus]|uniref:glutathione S-transferase 2-like n=1 Tax=Melanerpes formicivorus TaxID=211600 RepID=UPI00358F7BC1